MKRRTPKTAALYRAAEKVRQRLRDEIHCCDRCGGLNFDLHEIVRCNLRKYVAGEPALILALCSPGCHQEAGEWSEVRQLALLLITRPHYFNLQTYNRWAVARVTPEDVEAEIDGLLSDLARF
jgi:hypothetical protein